MTNKLNVSFNDTLVKNKMIKMKLNNAYFLTTFFVIFISASLSSQEKTFSLLVALKESASVEDIKSLKFLNKSFNLTSMRILGVSNRSSEEKKLLTSRLIRLKFPSTTNKIAVNKAYKDAAIFKYVELDYVTKGKGIPNDTFFSSNQYYHVNNGYDGVNGIKGKEDADMDTDLAWDITTGNENVVLGVLDSGLRLDHEEFLGRLWVNEDEIPNNGIDDDENGYIDDINGWDFVNNDNNPEDDSRHGTVVTGVAAATGNNGVGIAGMDWKCKIMVLKVLDNNIDGLFSDEIEAIFYAADNGIHVGNMSFGGMESSAAFQEAVEYAHSKGVLLVAASGNEGREVAQFPAAYRTVMAVGGSHPDDTRITVENTQGGFGSNYGDHLDVVAPGSGIFSTRILRSDAYGFFGGTSFSAPMVSGLACLIKGLDMSKTPDEIREIIQNSAEDLIGNKAEDTEGYDNFYGFGRINAHNALLLTQADFDLKAQFTFSNATICGSEVVTFTNTSIGNPTSLKWSFGEGAMPQTATGVGPHEIIYTSNGQKTTVLEIKNAATRDAEVKRNVIAVGAGFLNNISGSKEVSIEQTETYTVPIVEGVEEYIWSVPNGTTIVSGDLTNSIEVAFGNQPGKVEISVLIINRCDEEEFTEILVEVSNTLSANSVFLENRALNVFPNPSSSGIFHLSEASKFMVYDIRGRLLQKGNGNVVDLSGNSIGIYFLKINNKTIKLLR